VQYNYSVSSSGEAKHVNRVVDEYRCRHTPQHLLGGGGVLQVSMSFQRFWYIT
jgi:hypothetical protein